MPYIPDERRNPILTGECPENAGELNYLITETLNRYIQKHGLRYQYINDCLGALAGAQLEFYRRIAAPYENMKADPAHGGSDLESTAAIVARIG